MPFVSPGTVNSAPIELSYEDHSTDGHVALIHGYPLDCRSWEKQLPAPRRVNRGEKESAS